MWRAKLIATILVIAALFSLSACGQSAGREILLTDEVSEAKTANYRTSTAKEGDLIKTSQLSLEPIYYLSQTIYCKQSGLYFDSFSVSRGDTVKEGQLIATFTRQGSEAELESCQIALRRANEEYDRQVAALQSAVDEAAGTRKELAQLDLDQYIYNQSVELKKLEAAVSQAEAAFENEYIYAPFDCVVASLASLDKGALVDSGKELAELKVADSLLLYSTTTAKNFLYNMDVTIEYGRKDERLFTDARVVSNDAVLPDGVMGDGYTYFKVNSPMTEDELYKPAASVTTVQAKNALLVPRGAVQVEDGRYYVSVLDGEMVKKRFIIRGIVGGTVGESCAVVLAGVKSGQTVILD